MSRKERRAEMFKARKAQRKAGFATTANNPVQPSPAMEDEMEINSTAACQPQEQPPQPEPEPLKPPISAARLAANQANAQKSHGALTPETKLNSSLNHTIHGLARHRNGTFKILGNEDTAVFESFKESIFDEHQPATPTEVILVTRMVESEWLAQRAFRLQVAFTDPVTGIVRDDQKFSLYSRYQTTHIRAFHKSLSELNKMRADKRKAELGVEAQKLNHEAQVIKNERHNMKKAVHDCEVHMKNTDVLLAVSKYTDHLLDLKKKHPAFATELEAEFQKRGIQMGDERVILAAA